MRKYYKVTSKNLQSIVMNDDTELSTQYKVGEFVSSPIPETPLLVFKSLKDAKDFVRGYWYTDYKIFECQIKNRVRIPWVPDFKTFHDDIPKLLKLIKNKKKFLHILDLTGFPKGTVAAKRVKLIKEVK